MKVTNQSIAPTGGAVANGKAPFSQVIAMPSYQAMLANAIQDPTRRMRFVTNIVSLVSANPALKTCTPDSIISAALQIEALNLNPTLGEAHVIPYGSKATFQMGAKGYRQLAMRSGQYLDIDDIEVRLGEYKGRSPQNGKPIFEFISDDDMREDLPIVGYLAYFTLLNGFQASVYFSKAKMIKWASRYSQSFNEELYNKYLVYLETGEGMTENELRLASAPWISSFEAQASKTVIKQLLSKKGILSVELIDAFKNDMSDGTTDGTAEMNFVDPNAEEQTPAEPTEETKQEEPQEEPTQKQTTRKGRPPKVVANVVPDDAKPQATKPFAPAPMEFDGDF